MANIFVAVEQAEGHVFPTLPLLKKLSELHNVVCMTGRQHKIKIENTGATFTPMPIEFDPNGKDLYDFHPELKRLTGIKQIKFYINDRFLEMVLPVIEAINKIRLNFEPDLYIVCPVSYGPFYLAEKLKKPCVEFNMLPLAIQSKDHAPFGTGIIPKSTALAKIKYSLLNSFINKVVFKSTLKKANAIRKELGINPMENFFYENYSIQDKVLTTSVPEFDYYRSDAPKSLEYIGPILPKKSENFIAPEWWSDLKSGKKIVLVNQGTLATNLSDLIIPTIEALKDEDCIVIAVPVKDAIENLPSNTRTSDFIPFAHLLPYVDIMITNGGFGATQMALAHGIPLILGGNTVEEKMEISARVVYSGCGIDLKKQKVTPLEIINAYNQINSDNSYKENAMKMKEIIEPYDPINKALSIIEELLK